mmetsp:Transcript_32471/g.66377  ORF Transcript_32471/g.66377 Transcript_32471/m.66377 type:complete len:246 (-) Transcript_32471:688-1425(-)
MDLDGPGPLDQFVDAAHDGVLGELGDVVEEVELLAGEERRLLGVLEGGGPEGSHVDAAHLRCHHHLPQVPHQCTVHPHQVLRAHPISLVQHHPDLVGMGLHQFDHPLQLVRYVQLVCVEHDHNEVGPFREPPHDGLVVVIPPYGLLLTTQNPGGVHQCDVPQYWGVHLHPLEAAEEVVAIGTEAAEGPIGLGAERCSRDDLVSVSGHDGSEAVGGGFGADAYAGEVAAEEVADEGGLADAVLSQK